jgi:hypothetical protein
MTTPLERDDATRALRADIRSVDTDIDEQTRREWVRGIGLDEDFLTCASRAPNCTWGCPGGCLPPAPSSTARTS